MDELRRWLAARLSPRTRVDDWRLDELIDAVNRTDPIYIQRAVRGEEADRNDLLAEAQNHWITITRSSKGSARPISTGGKGEGRWLDPDEQGHLEKTILRTTSTLRMHAFAEGLARLMAKEAPVQHIRAALLGSPMTRQEAEAFSRSPAMRLCTPDEVQRYGIPLVGHSWRLLSEDIDEFGVYRSWEFIVEPPGYIITGELVGDPPSEPQFIRVENGEPDLFVRDDSVLGEVLKVAEWLANRYLVDARHAVHLILVNSLPPISPIRPYPPPTPTLVRGPRIPVDSHRTHPGDRSLAARNGASPVV